MIRKEVIQAIRDLFKEAGLDSLESDIKRIHDEILKDTPPTFDSRKTSNQTATSIEAEMYMAKFNGLQDLIKDKERKLALDLSIPLSLIRELIQDEDIKNAAMAKAVVITHFEIQNGTNETKALKRLKSSLSNTLERVYGKSKREAEEIVLATSFAFFGDSSDSFKNRSKKSATPTYTDYGFILNLHN